MVAKARRKDFDVFVVGHFVNLEDRNRRVHDKEALMPVALAAAILEEAKTSRVGSPDYSPPRHPAFEATLSLSLYWLCCHFSLYLLLS